MRAAALSLVLAVSPLGLTICRSTCATPVATHQNKAETPACHEESTPPSDGLVLKGEGVCRHSEGASVLAKTSPAFQLTMTSASAPAFVAPSGRVMRVLNGVLIRAGLHPPPLLPLRI